WGTHWPPRPTGSGDWGENPQDRADSPLRVYVNINISEFFGELNFSDTCMRNHPKWKSQK
ncbi:MAG: hypothetical protein N2235_25865, partial [Fischerella sp.]|nr:hypothetical protein [Fischerella sp.]